MSDFITHGTHTGMISWLKHDLILVPNTVDVNPKPAYKYITLIHVQGGPTLQIDGTYIFRLGARYTFHLINGGLVSADIVTSK